MSLQSDATDDDEVLRAMLTLAERLCATGDAMLIGQYAYLRARIDALIELRRVSDQA